MAECYQCGNGFGFRGKKINKNEIKKERKKLLYSYRKYVETDEVLKTSPEAQKEILEFRKHSTFDIFSNKMSNSDLICEKCFITYLHDNYAREIWIHNLLTLTADQRIQYARDYPEFSIKHDKQKVEFEEYQKKIHQNKSKVENISNNAEDKDNSKTETPLKILKVRLAKGEITLEEFSKIKEHLD